jgi:hypothetical protein
LFYQKRAKKKQKETKQRSIKYFWYFGLRNKMQKKHQQKAKEKHGFHKHTKENMKVKLKHEFEIIELDIT